MGHFILCLKLNQIMINFFLLSQANYKYSSFIPKIPVLEITVLGRNVSVLEANTESANDCLCVSPKNCSLGAKIVISWTNI